VREVGGIAGRKRCVEGSADSHDLSVSGADRATNALPFRDHDGVLISSKDVEGLDPATEVGADKRMDRLR
jgi:hypothetical protein